MRVANSFDLGEKTRYLPRDPMSARAALLAVFAEHAAEPDDLPTALSVYAPRPDRSVTLLSMHVHDEALVLAVPDDVIAPDQRAAVDAAAGGWFESYQSYDGPVSRYAAATRVCAWTGFEGDGPWARHRDEAAEIFSGYGEDASDLPTVEEIEAGLGIWSAYVVLGGPGPWPRQDLLAERPSCYAWIRWRD